MIESIGELMCEIEDALNLCGIDDACLLFTNIFGNVNKEDEAKKKPEEPKKSEDKKDDSSSGIKSATVNEEPKETAGTTPGYDVGVNCKVLLGPMVEIVKNGKAQYSHAVNTIAKAASLCYNTDVSSMTLYDKVNFIKRALLDRGHESPLEHYSITVKFTVDRGITHELVRHRIASYTMESTRYCNYGSNKLGNMVTVIKPSSIEYGTEDYYWWKAQVENECRAYLEMLDRGFKPEIARSLLPHAVAANIMVTANIREWRHIFKLRASKNAHPDIAKPMIHLLNVLTAHFPVFFEDLCMEINNENKK